jgi:hypothetical protein
VLRLPLLPAPFLDETFGSWFERSAESYRMEVRDFASAILRVDRHKLPRYFDLDCEPPEALLSALAKYSSLRRSELERLIVQPTAAILSVMNRDAYCPQFFSEDREYGAHYRRKALLDSWTIIYERHSCALGRFESVQYSATNAIGELSTFIAPRELPLHSPSVISVKLPHLLYDDGAHADRFIGLLRIMLKKTSGRDLLLHIGSASADVLYYELTGIARLWNRVWHDAERTPLWPPAIEHPLGSIETRVNAAYVATYLWDRLYKETNRRRGKVAQLFADELRRSEHVISRLQVRWSRSDREHFGMPVG